MATQKLFGDIPSGMSGIAGMVSPNITADITPKSEEDDASTLAGYRKRLELQSGQEAAAYQNRLNFQRQMQQQWQQEDMKKEADMMRQLDAQRRQAFDVIYRPQVESQIRTSNLAQQQTAAAANPQTSNQLITHGNETYDPASGALRSGGMLIGGAASRTGSASPQQVQQAMNTMYGRTAAAQAAQNTNPYYRPGY